MPLALVVSHGHPAFSVGGAEVASYNLHRGLGEGASGWASHYLARIGPPLAPHRNTPLMAVKGGENETLYWAESYDWLNLSNPELAVADGPFERFLRELGPDLVHFHHVLGFGVEAIRAARRALGPSVPIVLTLHEYLSICHHYGQMVTPGGALCERASALACGQCFPEVGAGRLRRRELFLKSFYRQVDAFVSPSRFLADRYVDWGLPADRVHVLENGLASQTPAPPRPPQRNGRRGRFAFFGRLNSFKGVHVLLEAVTRVPVDAWGENSLLYLHGSAAHPESYAQEIRRLVHAAGRRVRFVGPYKSADLPRLMREVDWVVMPSIWWENAPVVIQEAFHHGRPLIASDIGGMAEKVRDRLDGLHFRAGSPDSLADCLERALREPGLWDRLRSRIRRPPSAIEAADAHATLYLSLRDAKGSDRPGTAAA
jgi:glycosyltransferase involved in cell wall biosynthesis